MVRIAKISDPRRIASLKIKITDPVYMDAAIRRIAHKLTEKLVVRVGIVN